MRLRPRLSLVCALILMPLASVSAQLRLSGTGTLTELQEPFAAFNTAAPVQYEFLLPQAPIGEPLPPAAFLLSGIAGRFTQGATALTLQGDLIFFTAEFEGGFTFEFPAGFAILDAVGAQLFTRGVTAPVFRTGTFSIEDFPDGGGVLSAGNSVVISTVATVPEPGSLVLLVSGAMMLMVIVARRRRVQPAR
jgi:hypothetical protein